MKRVENESQGFKFDLKMTSVSFVLRGHYPPSATLSPNNYPSQSPTSTRLTAQANKWEVEKNMRFNMKYNNECRYRVGVAWSVT
jgi:hypothetical protein